MPSSGFTRSVIALEDGQYAILLPGQVCVKDIATRQMQPKTVLDVDWNVESAQKGGHPHLHDQGDPRATPRRSSGLWRSTAAAIDGLADMIARYRRTYLVGVGITHHVAQMAQYYFSALARTFIP